MSPPPKPGDTDDGSASDCSRAGLSCAMLTPVQSSRGSVECGSRRECSVLRHAASCASLIAADRCMPHPALTPGSDG
eukprot:1234221-Rhodomonas_salina.1